MERYVQTEPNTDLVSSVFERCLSSRHACVCVCVRARPCLYVRTSAVIVHMATGVTLTRSNHKAGLRRTDADAIPMPRRRFAFVRFIGIITGGKRGWSQPRVMHSSMSRRGYFPHRGGVLLGMRAAAALCCLGNAGIVPHPRASGHVCLHI